MRLINSRMGTVDVRRPNARRCASLGTASALKTSISCCSRAALRARIFWSPSPSSVQDKRSLLSSWTRATSSTSLQHTRWAASCRRRSPLFLQTTLTSAPSRNFATATDSSASPFTSARDESSSCDGPHANASVVAEVELMPPADAHSSYASCGETGSTEAHAAAEVVSTVDTFAKARVANCIQRLASESHDKDHTSAFDVREVQGGDEGDGGGPHFYARQLLPLPPPYGNRYGEGFAATVKEAESLASMHAERVLDSLGIPIFLLSSKQRRHAEAARAAGRWAPLPGEAQRPPGTPVPPPLRLVKEGVMERRSSQLGLDNLVFTSVRRGAFTPLRWTLASPYFLDLGSVRRLRDFFAAYHKSLDRYARVLPLHSHSSRAGSSSPGARGDGDTADSSSVRTRPGEAEPTMFVARVPLPVPTRFGERVCLGKAPTRREALALACMHAELTIDALGLALYPNNRERQAAHAAECRQVQRYCAEPGDYDYRYTTASPPPLQLMPGVDQATVAHQTGPSQLGVAAVTGAKDEGTTPSTSTAEVRAAGISSLESKLAQHSRAIDRMDRVLDVPTLEPHARAVLQQHLNNFLPDTSTSSPAPVSPFFVESLGIAHHETYRATVTVPLGESGDPSAAPSSASRRRVSAHSVVAMGLADTHEKAEAAAAMHALELLRALGRAADGALSPAQAPRATVKNPDALADGAWPPVIRSVGDEHVGRIIVPGLFAERRARQRVQHAEVRRTALHMDNEGHLLKELRKAQATLPREAWSLEADGDHRIIVPPDATASGGRNYVHTLPAVRSPDVFATNRLKDYLERHGKRIETAVRTTRTETDEDQLPPMWVATVTLPVPVSGAAYHATSTTQTAAPRYVAVGEAFTEDDAVLMCAMHAELLLDALGLPLYDHFILQRKHADCARMLGRWAPLCARAVPPALGSRLPPPVRKAHPQSCVWARLEKQRRSSAAAARHHAVPHGGRAEAAEVAQASPTAPTGGDASIAADPHVGGHPTHVHAAAAAVGWSPKPLEAPTDDALCRADCLQTVHDADIFRHALKHVQHYFHSRGEDFFRAVRQYTQADAQYGVVHRALAEVPVPAQFGKRYAVGCASNKRQALSLCANHAVWLLDALGIQVYQGKRQMEYAAAAARRGRHAPKPGDTLQRGDTPSPKGLCCFAGDVMVAPEVPVVPSVEAVQRDARVWVSYVRACRAFLVKRHEAELHEAVVVLRQAPRRGIGVEDTGLDVVERVSPDARAKSKLPGLCATAGLPPPPLFRYEVCGRAPHRQFITEQPVLGTPYTARGVGETGAASITRAAMHYEFIVTHAGLGNSPAGGSYSQRLIHSATQRRGGQIGWLGGADGHHSLVAQATALVIFAAAYPPFAPLHITRKERVLPAGSSAPVWSATRSAAPHKAGRRVESSPSIIKGPSSVHVALVELEDETGLRVAGKGEHAEAPEAAVARAVADLCRQLERRPNFQALVQLVQRYPALRATALCTLVDESKAMQLVRAASHLPSVLPSATTVVDALRAVPLFANEGFYGSAQVALLLDLAERALGQSTTHASLTLSLSARERYPLLGFCTHVAACEEAQLSGVELTPQAIAVAYLVQCLPALPAASPASRGGEDALKGEAGGPTTQVQRSPWLPLQLARLLLAGLLWRCPQYTARVAALIACAEVTLPSYVAYYFGGSEWAGTAHSVDILDVLRHYDSVGPPPSCVVQYEAELLRRLRGLAAVAYPRAPDSPFSALLHDALLHAQLVSCRLPESNDATTRRTLRLRLLECIAFATFPRVLAPRPTSPMPAMPEITLGPQQRMVIALESIDTSRRTTTTALVPSDLTHPPRACAAPRCGEAARRGDELHCRLPCFVCFECEVAAFYCAGDAAQRGSSGVIRQENNGEVIMFGTFVPPVASLVASTSGCNTHEVLRTAEDVPMVGLLFDGAVPLVTQSAAALNAIRDLQGVMEQYLSVLHPLPADVQAALDALVGAEYQSPW